MAGEELSQRDRASALQHPRPHMPYCLFNTKAESQLPISLSSIAGFVLVGLEENTCTYIPTKCGKANDTECQLVSRKMGKRIFF